MLGIKTFSMAIPTPINAVPINNPNTLVYERTISPNNIKIRPIIIVLPNPSFLEIVDTKGETIAKAINGRVVIKPAVPLFRLNSVEISSTCFVILLEV